MNTEVIIECPRCGNGNIVSPTSPEVICDCGEIITTNNIFVLRCPSCLEENFVGHVTDTFVCDCGEEYILTVCDNCEEEIPTGHTDDDGICPYCGQPHTE